MSKTLIAILVAIAVSFAFVAGCESDAQTGALVGTAIGAGAGQAIGRDTSSTILGGVAGGAIGYGLGNEGDKKKAAADREKIREEMNTVMVNVTNSNGSVIQVPLKKQGVGYAGPRGEYYDKLPT